MFHKIRKKFGVSIYFYFCRQVATYYSRFLNEIKQSGGLSFNLNVGRVLE